MDVVREDEETVLRKSEKKKHKEKEAISTSQVPTENKKHKDRKEKASTSSLEVPTEKRKHKKSKEKEALSTSEVPTEKRKHNKSKEKVPTYAGGEKKVSGSEEKQGVSDINGKEMICKHKKKKDKEKITGCSDLECASDQATIGVGSEENVEHMKKWKGKKDIRKKENGGVSGESCLEKSGDEAQSGSRSSRKRDREEEVLDVTTEGKNKKKTKLDADVENSEASIGDVEMQNNLRSTDEFLRNSDSKKSSKRVKFASQVEVFSSSDDKDDREEIPGKKLIQGKRFTKKEDQIIKDAVYNYIEARKLGEKGLDMILHCQQHQIVRNCWKEIGTALPCRPTMSVYERAHILFERAESHKWTEDEKAFIIKFVDKHGPDWKPLAEVLGKSRRHTKDIYRRLSREGLKKGRWSQAEYQSLFHFVKKDLRMRVFEEKTSKHGMLRDNISWTAISHRVATRAQDGCCMKWYNQLTSSLVRDKKWADADDYRLLNELYKLDACCIEDVDWDNLLEHRSGDITLKRWRQMVIHIGEHGLQSFAEQVELLAKRYCPELLEVKEAFDSKPFVD